MYSIVLWCPFSVSPDFYALLPNSQDEVACSRRSNYGNGTRRGKNRLRRTQGGSLQFYKILDRSQQLQQKCHVFFKPKFQSPAIFPASAYSSLCDRVEKSFIISLPNRLICSGLCNRLETSSG